MAIAECTIVTDSQGRETAQHGSALLPIACYEDDLIKFSVPWHWHEEFECIVSTEGTVEVLVEGSRLTLRPGEGVFINAGALHAVEAGTRDVSVLRSIVFHPRLISGSMDSIFWQKLVAPLAQEGAPHYLRLDPALPWQKDVISGILEVWHADVTQPEDFELFLRYRLSRVFRQLCLHCAGSPAQRQDPVAAERIKHMLRYISEHYREELTLSSIAASVNISGSVCLRCFRQMMGTTPLQYVNQFRIEKAAQLLLSSDQQIQQIGLSCGFSDLSYFAKRFRAEKGCSPKQYREEQKQFSPADKKPGTQ